MTLSERALYHQIHPVKLATDWAAALASVVLLWRHRLAAGLMWGLLPPVLVSLPFLLGYLDRSLVSYSGSTLGRYLARSMTRAMEGLRLLGLLGLWVGAWRRSVAIMGVGGVVIAAAWLRGWILEGITNDTAT
jgi:hypothetical protein